MLERSISEKIDWDKIKRIDMKYPLKKDTVILLLPSSHSPSGNSYELRVQDQCAISKS